MTGINLASLAEGALQERFEQDLQKIAENIQDENTDAKAKRKLTITLIFEPDKERDYTDIDIQTKTNLAPIISTTARVYIDRDMKTNKTSTYELKKGAMANQIGLGDLGENKTEEESKNIVQFKSN